MRCWVCVEEKICLPYKSNPNGIMEGARVMLCRQCKKRVDALPKRPWENKEKKNE